MFIENHKLSNAFITYTNLVLFHKIHNEHWVVLFPCVSTPAKNLTMQGHPEPEVT